MSNDLISRKSLIEILNMRISDYSCDSNSGYKRMMEIYLYEFMPIIEHAPTAYDVDAVCKELEEELKLADKEKERCIKENPLQFDSAKGYANGIANALEIVRNGVKK